MTPEEAAQQEEKRKAFRGWATGFYDNLRRGGGSLSVTRVQPIQPYGEQQAREPELQGREPTGPSTQNIPPSQNLEPAPTTTQQQPPMDRPSSSSEPPVDEKTKSRARAMMSRFGYSGPAQEAESDASNSVAPSGENREGALAQAESNRRANDAFRRYMSIFAGRRS